MIVATPLDLPKIEPDNWDIFWAIWNKHSDWVNKIKLNHSHSLTPVGTSTIWKGLDIYKRGSLFTTWQAPYFNIANELPVMHSTLSNLKIPNLKLVRLISSKCALGSHSDDRKDTWSIRAFLYYPSDKPQWYFTKPENALGHRTYISLPNDTNWFAYNDLHSWHGTEYDPNNEKILVQLYFDGTIDSLLKNSIEKYKNYTITLNE